MAPSSSSCVYLFSDFEGMMFASGDDHKWRRKRDKLNKDDEAIALMRLLIGGVNKEVDLQRKLHKMS